MIHAIIIDDEKHCIETLSIMLTDHCPGIQIIETCRSGKVAIDAIRKLRPDLVFLDVEMPLMNGFEMLEQFPAIDFAVIFTTSYDKYAVKAIKYSALDYLLKPVDRTELEAAVKKVQQRKQLPFPEQFEILLGKISESHQTLKKLAIPTADGYQLIGVDFLLRCEANDNYTHIFLKDRRKLIASRTLKEIEEQLEDFANFIRVHNSHVVNINEVEKYVRGDGGYLLLSDGSTVTVSRTRKESLLRKLNL